MADERRFSRTGATPHYHRLIEFYGELHHQGGLFETGDAETPAVEIPPRSMFEGGGLLDFAGEIQVMALRHDARSVLDYGAGKGVQYDKSRAVLGGKPVDIRDYWGVQEIHAFDPGVDPEATPRGADGVISTDVLEHCFHADIPWIVEEMFTLANKFVWCNVDCFPARKLLPNGENVHITVREPDYWRGVFETIGNFHPNIDWEIGCRHEDRKRADDATIMTFHRRPEVETTLTENTRFAR
jgi:hypothetical protein